VSSTIASAVFDDHQHAPQPMRPRGRAHRSRADQSLLPLDARRLERREQPEHDAAHGRGRDGERKGGAVETDGVEAWQALGCDSNQRAQQPEREADAEHTTDGGNERALDQHLPGQPRAPAAERGSHRQLVLSRRAAGNQQVGDVDAGDQQQDADRAEQREQRDADVGDDAVGQRLGVGGDAGIGFRGTRVRANSRSFSARGPRFRPPFQVSAGRPTLKPL
jgi:hypothetical protein